MLAGVVRNTGRLYSRNFCPSPPQVESGKGHRFEKNHFRVKCFTCARQRFCDLRFLTVYIFFPSLLLRF